MAKLFQIAAIEHTESLGAGREYTLDKGLLWIVSRIKVSVKRPLVYGEKVVFKSWPLETMHVIFPRCYSIETEEGDEIIKASSLWMLIDSNNRKMVFPDEYNITIPADNGMPQYPSPADLVPFEGKSWGSRTIEYTDLDLNGHVNNTTYFDWVDSIHNEEWHKNHFYSDFQMNFRKELSGYESPCIYSEETNDVLRVKGLSKEKDVFAFQAKVSEIL